MMGGMSNAQAMPAINSDGTITAVVAAPARLVGGALHLPLALPARLDAERTAGRFVMARCGAQSADERAGQWSIYLRRPLYVAGATLDVAGVAHASARGEMGATTWHLCAPDATTDPGYNWLAARCAGETVNLTGPFGSGFPPAPLIRRLLLLADPVRLGLLSPLIDGALDRGGQVSVLLLEGQPGAADVAAMRRGLPLSVELHTLDGENWPAGLGAGLRWADQVCVALPRPHLPLLAEAVRQVRLRLESGFAFCLVEADLVCGYGACLACVVPLASGSLTRACVHGPVFDLLELAGKG